MDGRIQRRGKKNSQLQGCTDYRQFFFCRLMGLDGGLIERGITFRLVFIVVASVISETFSFLSIFASNCADQKLDCMRVFILGLLTNVAPFNEYTNRHALDRLHKFLDRMLLHPSRTGLKEEKIILEDARHKSSKAVNFYIRIFSGYLGTMLFAMPLAELLMGHSWKKLPIPWSIPSTDTDAKFLLVFGFQSVAVVISNCLGMIMMSFSAITVQMTALFEVLLFSIRHIEDRAAVNSKCERISYRDAMVACLREDIMFYQDIVRELTSATPHLRNMFMACSVSIPVVMACEAYPLVSGNFVLGALIKSCIFFSIILLCWAQICTKMETMTDKHKAVARALYETPWYENGLKFRKMVYLTLVFANQPKYIKARFSIEINANTDTFYSFSVSSFNYLNLMRKMN
uniref:Odorant receptor n=1 Tax=Cyrtorhinus lividipennis TaxID=1032904 RepID=A0A346TI22_9HEMI|nr:odorant receptor 14 [Cyrtorhinus lividipennis]